MKKVSNLLVLICFAASIATFLNCLKEPALPEVTTNDVSNIKTQSASTSGNVIDDGGAEVDVRGVCFGTAKDPIITGSRTFDDKGTGSFTSIITGLTPETYYHVRAYATNFLGIAYGGDVTFSTRYKPVVTTAAVTKFTQTIATISGNVIWTNGSNVIERGICYGAAPDPTIEGTHIVGEIQSLPGFGKFTCNLTDLTPGTHYHVRAYVIVLWLGSGEEIMVYGNEVTFTTSQ
jgi:hypothetical protein